VFDDEEGEGYSLIQPRPVDVMVLAPRQALSG
jgi:hypothetical protein